jgi:hypothetical protein
LLAPSVLATAAASVRSDGTAFSAALGLEMGILEPCGAQVVF